MAMPAPRVLFVNPPLTLPRDFIDYPYFANHGLLSAAGWAARGGAEVAVADAFALPGSGRTALAGDRTLLGVPVAELEASLPDGPFDAVVIGASPFLRVAGPDDGIVALTDGLRGRHPAAALVLADCHAGGMHHADYDGEAVLRRLPAIDAVVKYAGERTLADPAGLAALRGSRRVVDDPAAEWPSPPPFPAVDLLDGPAFGAFLWRCFGDGAWANPFGVGPTTRSMLTSSGCPYRCVFCSSNPGWRATGRKPYRVVPLPVVEEWAYLLARGLGARKLFVLDEVANLRPDFEAVLDALARLDLAYEFPNGLRADRLAEAAIRKMAGRVSLLCVSAESGNPDDLAGPIGKRLDLAEVERVARQARDARVPLLVHYVVGFPWETPRHVAATLEHAFKVFETWGAEPAVQFATPLPGTELHAMCADAGLLPEGGIDLADGALFQHRPAFLPPGLPAGFLELARASLQRKVAASRTRKVIVNLTYECINRCVFCAVSNRVRRDIPWDRLKAIVEEHRAAGVELIDFDGGEPTLHPRFLDVLRLAAGLGYRQVHVTTNGRRLADRSLAAAVAASGVTSLQVSIHGSHAAVHDAITRVPGSFAETLAGLRNVMALKPNGLDVGVNLTVARPNLHDVAGIVELAWKEGVGHANVQLVTPFGRAGADLVPTPDEAFAAVREAIDRFGDRVAIQVVNGQFCRFPGYESYLVGDVGKLGRTMVFATEEEVNLFRYLGERRAKREECSRCPWGMVCEGFFEFGEGEPDAPGA
jgi:MoaA/NifB/PqqE/SkfB family radical SAM enzyme